MPVKKIPLYRHPEVKGKKEKAPAKSPVRKKGG